MTYRHFLLDLDDTLLDFKASERLSFHRTLASFGVDLPPSGMFTDYQRENQNLWLDFENGRVAKEFLKVERFRRTFANHGLDADPYSASRFYLECLPETVVLVDGARELCEALVLVGEVGIITNGIDYVQSKRIEHSGLSDLLSFVATSESCGYAKPDPRFFEFTANKFHAFTKRDAIIVGDRLDADILGAHRYGIDSCWFNASRSVNETDLKPTYESFSLQDVAMRITADR